MAIFRYYNFIFKNIGLKELVTNAKLNLKNLLKTETTANKAFTQARLTEVKSASFHYCSLVPA